MSLEIGIVGLPNVGKSTLFNALTKAQAAVASYPFTTIDRNIGVTPVEDHRLQRLAEVIHPEKVTPTTVRFVDIAGLVRGAHRGEGLGNQFLGHIRDVDAIALVVRCFQDPDVPHVSAELDPLDDIETIDTELILADLATVERRLERVQGVAKARPKEVADELRWLEGLRERLNGGQPARGAATTEQEAQWLRELNLLTAKPRMLVANVGEDDLPEGGPLAQAVLQAAEREGSQAVVICAQLEMELADWPPEEAAAYRRELGLAESGLQRLVRAGYRLLGLITFFTVTGGREVRAWTVRQGATALEAAGKVHTDMQRGFIRAEVIPWDDLVQIGSLAAAREKGLLRLEGREYVVQDGDVIHFRFAI